jgi:hypothetical protein
MSSSDTIAPVVPIARKAGVLKLPPESTLTDKHRGDLEKSGLNEESIKLARVYTEIDSKKIAAALNRKGFPSQCGNALMFPFFLPGQSEPVMFRAKPTRPRVISNSNGKVRHARYESPVGAESYPYFAPRARAANAYADATKTLYWTEGEKKGLVFDQLGYVCVALTGVDMFGDPAYRQESGGGERLNAIIREYVVIAGRPHVICYDADARTNDNVMRAARKLAGLLEAGGALSVRFVCPRSPEHKGVDDFFVAFGEEATRALLATAETIEPIDPRDPLPRLKSFKSLESAPIMPELRCPNGYEIDRAGALWKRANDDKHSDQKIASKPIFVQRYLEDHATGEERADVCFLRNDGRWASVCASRKALADSRTLVSELAPYGAPVTSNNAARFVDWLDDLDSSNVGRIPRVKCVARAGWHTIDGVRRFVLNDVVQLDNDESVSLALDNRGDRRKLFGSLRSVAEGKSEAEREKLENAHVDVLQRAWRADDVCAAMIAAALAAPLLEVLGAPNFGVHLPGDSSRGKTSMLKIAASVYGDPNDPHWLASWGSTPVAAELRAAVFTDLPQAYDEAGLADPEATERLVYMLINGGGRGRGSRDLTLRETPSWRTIVLSTGERSLTNEAAATGAQIRIIHLPVSGFGKHGAETVDELRETSIAHAGVFGRMWIETLLSTDDWTPIRQTYKEFVKLLRSQAPDPLAQRLAGYFAVLCVAETLAAQLGLGDAGALTMQRLFREPSKRSQVQSVADRARALALDWVLSERDAFPLLERNVPLDTDDAQRKGVRVVHGFRKEGRVMFIPAQFRQWCARQNLSADEVLRGWSEHGWLVHDNKRLTDVVKVEGRAVRLYVLTAEAADPHEDDALRGGEATP